MGGRRQCVRDYREEIEAIRGPGYVFYVLRSGDALFLIDGGFVFGVALLKAGLQRRDWNRLPIKGIILTHGHLDHTFNIRALQELTGCWVAAPRLDAEHYAGHYAYHGAARVCGVLEAIGRSVLRYQQFRVDRWLDDGSELDLWDGLRAIHLPGHTAGHSGYYSERHQLLFSGDLFASYAWGPHFPPDVFNSSPEQLPASVERALSLRLAGVLPNHGDLAEPGEHLRRLRTLRARLGRANGLYGR